MPRNLNNITQTSGYTVIKPNIPLEWSSMYMAKTNQGTGGCGKIIPVFTKELMPNQTINLEQSVALQFTPFVSNLFHQIRGELMTFFVPYRICAFMRQTESIDEDKREEADQIKWEAFITGGKSGNDNQSLDVMNLRAAYNAFNGDLTHTLFDYFGMPIHQTETGDGSRINALPFNAYNLIYNTKFRNPDYTDWKNMIPNTNDQRRECFTPATAYWNADRFTRARKAQYRGIAPTIPITNELLELAVKFSSKADTTGQTGTTENLKNPPLTTTIQEDGEEIKVGLTGTGGYMGTSAPAISGQVDVEPNALGVNIDYNEFLYNLAVLKYETNNARIKPLYVEHLKYRYGIFPQDSRFQEPEWLSSNSFDIGIDINQATAGTTQISESGETLNYTQNDQGKITSQGWGSGRNLRTEYKALEHGIIMTLMIIRPEPVYEGGLDRHWWADRTRFDFPTPEMMNLPDQKIWKGELHFTGVQEDDKELFGWEQIYDQDRTETNQVCGLLRPSITGGLNTYTLANYFETAPELNNDFLQCKPDMQRIKQYPNQPDFIFFVRSEIKTALPMPIINEPINIGI